MPVVLVGSEAEVEKAEHGVARYARKLAILNASVRQENEMTMLITCGLGLLLLIGAILAFVRLRQWGSIIQILGGAMFLSAGLMWIFGPGDFVSGLPGTSAAESHMRYLQTAGELSIAGLSTFCVGYFATELMAFANRKSNEN